MSSLHSGVSEQVYGDSAGQPTSGSHVIVPRQRSWSHSFAVPWHSPAVHASFVVHSSPSSHVDCSGAGIGVHVASPVQASASHSSRSGHWHSQGQSTFPATAVTASR